MTNFEIRVTTDLLRPSVVGARGNGYALMRGDSRAHSIVVNVLRGGEVADLSGFTAACYAQGADAKYQMSGVTVSGNTVTAPIAQDVYNNLSGVVTFVVKLVNTADGVDMTAAVVVGVVDRVLKDGAPLVPVAEAWSDAMISQYLTQLKTDVDSFAAYKAQVDGTVTVIREEIGNRSSLNTTDKSNIVNAINEVNDRFIAPVGAAVNAWLDAHPDATTTVQDNSLTINKMVVGTLGYVTPKMFGAVGNGVADDTDAVIAAMNVSNGNFVLSDGVYKVRSITFDKHVMFMGGVILSSDRIVFEKPITAGRYAIFDGNGEVYINGNSFAYPEWFGAMCNGVNDDSIAINKAITALHRGTVILRDGAYAWQEGEIYLPDGRTAYFCSSPIIMHRGGVTIAANNRACVFTISNIGIKYEQRNDFIESSNVENILIGYTGSRISGSPFDFCAIRVENTSRCKLKNIRIQGYGNGVSIGTGNALMTIDGIEYRNTVEGTGSDQFIGLYMYGHDGGFVSSVINRFLVDFTSESANTIGILIEGDDIRDVWFHRCEVAKGKLGLLVSGQENGMAFDIRVDDFVHDQTRDQNIRIVNLRESGCIEINGGYLTGAESARGAIEVVNSPCTKISNIEIQGSTAPQYVAVNFVNSPASVVDGNRFVNCHCGIYSGNSDNIVVSNNTFKIQNDSWSNLIAYDYAMAFENVDNCMAIGNTFRTSAKKYGRAFFCSRTNCKFIGNAISNNEANVIYSVPEGTPII